MAFDSLKRNLDDIDFCVLTINLGSAREAREDWVQSMGLGKMAHKLVARYWEG